MKAVPSVRDNPKYAERLVEITHAGKIPPVWSSTPIEQFILSQNFGTPISHFDETPQLVIATCIEFRYALPIPSMYAYVIRRAGGRVVGSEFSLSYCLARGVKHAVLVGHNDCGMTEVEQAAPYMVRALAEQGWDPDRAAEFIERHAWRYRFKDELDSLEREYRRLKKLFKKLTIAPLFLSLAEARLYIPRWYVNSLVNGQEPADDSPVDDEVLRRL